MKFDFYAQVDGDPISGYVDLPDVDNTDDAFERIVSLFRDSLEVDEV